MKISHILGVLAGIISLIPLAQCQQIDWFVLNDAAHRISPQFLEVDTAGNSYVVGQYWGETMFRSADSSGKSFHTYTGEQLGKIFLTQYDHRGSCHFLVKIRSSGNDYLAPSAFHRLADGRLLLAAYTQSGLSLEDAAGAAHSLSARNQTALLFFSPDGILLSSLTLPMIQLNKIAESKTGRLYLLGSQESYSRKISGIFFLEKGENELQALTLSELPVTDFILLEDKLWYIVSEEKKGKHQAMSRTFELFSWDEKEPASTAEAHLKRSLEGYAFAATELMQVAGEIEIALRIAVIDPGRFRFEAEKDKPFAHHAIFIYTSSGEVKYFADFNHLYVSHLHLQGRENGGYYASAFPQKTFKLAGQDSIQPRAHSTHIFEKILLRFDEKMELKSYIFVGGANWQYAKIALHESKGKTIYASQLADYGYFGEDYQELHWRAGFYVMSLDWGE